MDQGVVRDPVLIVEILSPSTDAKDLNRKLPRYKRIASVAEILYVHTEKPEVLIYRRRGRSWETVTLGLGEIITLATVGLKSAGCRAVPWHPVRISVGGAVLSESVLCAPGEAGAIQPMEVRSG